jgi:hypothetical protein
MPDMHDFDNLMQDVFGDEYPSIKENAIRIAKAIKEGEPCGHPGCLQHLSHPCEKCGRKGGRR